MITEPATQSYVDYQLALNEQTHNRLWERLQQLEQEIGDLRNELQDAKNDISALDSQVSWLERQH